MSKLIKLSISQIQQLRGELMRYEASIPNAIEYLEALTSGHYTMGTGDPAKLKLYCDNLANFLKLVHRVDGNFPIELWQDETVKLLMCGYFVLLGKRLIPHTKAAAILDCGLSDLNTMLYPRRGKPKLTAYHDPLARMKTHGSRVDIEEVKALAAKGLDNE